ncbi:PHP domain-containing protein [Cyanobacterium aponinum]|uniref:PHP domain-containing protein n=1 Tax=Cyanobacterium aponinum TaxID=379064 RepID=UPI000C12D6E7|nr:PHP domain-containing protein [Cyanobacterium aponinum]PHV61456.1 phosphatase [Cyanobacterium aponinum IPPAS B-1201]
MLLKAETNPFQLLDERPQDTVRLANVWERVDNNSCPYQYNFHLHTSCSDGQLTPESLIEQAIALGLKGLAISDHHSVKGFYRAYKWLQEKSKFNPRVSLPYLWTGIEITSELNGTNVHILGYGFDPESEHLQKYLTGENPEGENAKAEKVIKSLHRAGGLVVLAHPFRYRRSAEELIREAYEVGIDGVEVYYAYGNPQPWIPSVKQTTQALKLARRYNLYTTCGTDTHGNNILIRL